MLLLEGGQGLDHLKNPCRHMETALVSVAVSPTRCRSHHRTHSVLSLLLLDGGICLPICSALADMEIGLVGVWRGSTLVLSKKKKATNILEYPKFFRLPLLQLESCLFIMGTTPEHQSYRAPCIQSTANLIWFRVAKCNEEDPAILTMVLVSTYSVKSWICAIGTQLPLF